MTQEVMHLNNTLPQAQVSAWLKMAEKKNALTATLTASELELQGLLLNVKDEDLVTTMSTYKTKHGAMKDARLIFTNAIDTGIVQPLMLFEKRSDPKTNAEYLAIQDRELGVRTKASQKLQTAQAVATETGSFKAHFINEFTRIVADLRLKYARIISETYQMCLTAKTPADEVHSAIQIAITAMGEIKPLEPAKFNRVYLEPAAASAIYALIFKPDYSVYLREAVEGINEKFSMYANDLANSDMAVASEVVSLQATIAETVQEANQDAAATTLITQAEAFVIAPEGFKGITETTRIKIEDDSQSWVVKILAAFLTNFGNAFPKVKVKKYSALTIAQMAAALDAAGIKVEGVTYENIVK